MLTTFRPPPGPGSSRDSVFFFFFGLNLLSKRVFHSLVAMDQA